MARRHTIDHSSYELADMKDHINRMRTHVDTHRKVKKVRFDLSKERDLIDDLEHTKYPSIIQRYQHLIDVYTELSSYNSIFTVFSQAEVKSLLGHSVVESFWYLINILMPNSTIVYFQEPLLIDVHLEEKVELKIAI